jgi:N-acetylneuraminic acid mutarotase
MRILRLATPISFAFIALLAVQGGAQTTVGTWSKAAPLPVIQSEWDGATVGDSLFMVGGEMKRTPQIDQTKASDELWIYDAKGDKWTQGANMPGGRNHPAVVSLEGLVYVFGGYNFPCCANYPWPYGSDNAWQYNPRTNAWKTLAPIPRKMGAGMAAAFDGKIYVMAGTDSGQFHSVAVVHEYDPVANSWRARSSMRNAREHVKGAVVDSLIYVIGGHSKPGSTKVNQAAVEAYSPRSDKWYEKGAMPTPRGGIGLAYLGGKIYVFGGEGADFKLFSQVDQFDPATGQWAKVNDIPYAGGIHAQATMVWNGKAHLVGGSNPQGFNPRNYHDVFTLPEVVGTLRQDPSRSIPGLGGKDRLRIEGMAPGLHRIAILDPMGRLLLSKTFSGTGTDLSQAALPAGTRFLRIEGPGDASIRRVLPRH